MTIEIENLLFLMTRSKENMQAAVKSETGEYLGYDADYWLGWAEYYEAEMMKATKG